MPVPSTMANLSTLAGSNSPQGTEAIGNSLDDYIRSVSAIVRSTNALSAATIPAASTVDVANSSGEYVIITGAALIYSLGTGYDGCRRELRFQGASTLVASANLFLPNGSNIITANGDALTFRCFGSGQWVMTASSRPLTASLGGVSSFMVGLLTAPDASTVLSTIGAQGALGYTPVNKAGDLMTGDLTIRKGVPIFSLVSAEGNRGYRVLANVGNAVDFGCALQNFNGSGWNAVTTWDASGNMTIPGTGTGVNWVATSDAILKKAINRAPPPAKVADRLRWASWIWKATGEADQGLIAQDIQEAGLGDFVVQDENGRLAVNYQKLAVAGVIDLAERIRRLECR